MIHKSHWHVGLTHLYMSVRYASHKSSAAAQEIVSSLFLILAKQNVVFQRKWLRVKPHNLASIKFKRNRSLYSFCKVLTDRSVAQEPKTFSICFLSHKGWWWTKNPKLIPREWKWLLTTTTKSLYVYPLISTMAGPKIKSKLENES